MDKNTVDVLFTEILNRHQSFFMLLIKDKFELDDAKDVFQDACLHLYQMNEYVLQDFVVWLCQSKSSRVAYLQSNGIAVNFSTNLSIEDFHSKGS